MRAWASIDGFEGRSSLRTWMYRIANNICVDMLRSAQRRARPMERGPSTSTAEAVLGDPLGDHVWIQAVADVRVIDSGATRRAWPRSGSRSASRSWRRCSTSRRGSGRC